MTPKKLIKSMSSTDNITTSTSASIVDNNNSNTNLDNEVLIYENGTVLGSVILIENISKSIDNHNNNKNNNDISTLSLSTTTSSSSSVNINKNYLNSVQNCDNQNSNNSMNNSYSINESSISINDSNNYCVTSNQNHIDRNFSEIDSNNSRILNETTSFEIENNSNNNNNNNNQTNHIELLNSSICSRESRRSKQRSRIQFTKKSQHQQYHHQDEHHQHEIYTNRYPPQYTAIYLDGNNQSGSGNNPGEILISDNLNQIQQFDNSGGRIGVAVPVVVPRNAVIDSDQRRGILRKLFRRPSLPFVVGILALGGVACTLGGIVLGSTGLVEHSTQYLSAALLMIGIGVSLLVISGAIWRLTIPDETENCPCFRHLETCRNCNSPFCSNRIIQAGFMYPEFQHRPPPPSYLTSLNECTVGLLLHHEVSTLQRNDTIRLATPPPAYRSSNSLSLFVPLQTHHHNLVTSDLQRTNTEIVEQITTEMSTVENPNNDNEIESPPVEI